MCMMHDIMMLMRNDAATIPVALISITSPDDWREHAVDEATFATSQEGRWTAICGAVVMSADLGSAPGRPCTSCADRRESYRQPGMTGESAATGATVARSPQRLLNDRPGNAEPRSRFAGRHRVAR